MNDSITAEGAAAPAGSGPWSWGRKAVFGLIGLGSLAIAGVGFVGSYSSVRRLAEDKGFGWFSGVFPLGIDIGIVVLLALDLALTWIGLRYPLLRWIAWVLTLATVAFNAAASWPDKLGAAMHAAIPLLFIAVTEAARHAIEQATAGGAARHMDSIRPVRWLLAPWSTWSIWKDMKLWEVRSYTVALERYQQRTLYRHDLRARYGKAWRREAPAAELQPLHRARLGLPILAPAHTATTHTAVPPEAAPSPAAADSVVPDGPHVPEVATGPADADSLASASQPLAGPGANLALDDGNLFAFAPIVDRVHLAHDDPDAADHGVAGDPAAEVRSRVQESAGDGPGTDEADVDTRGALGEPGRAGAAGVRHLAAPTRPDEDRGARPSRNSRRQVTAAVAAPRASFDAVLPAEGDDVPPVPLGPAPEGARLTEKAERIYLAHQEHGVALSREDLGRWAGYQQAAGSGRTQYTKYEAKHGPIVEGVPGGAHPQRAATGAADTAE